PGFRRGARQRPAPVHPGQPDRRRADAHHPRTARRGHPVLHPASDRAVPRADRRGRGRVGASLRAPALRDGRGQQEAVQARPAGRPVHLPEQGFIPEGMVNYLALLGWGYSADEDIFTRDQLIERFDASDVNPNPARVDLKKATAINADHIRLLEPADLTARMIPYLQQDGVLGEHVTDEQHELLAAATPLVHTRMNLLGDAPDLLRFLFIADEELVVADDALKKIGDDPAAVLE